ncbi:hypothetical protein EDD29_6861 [Actinocorallia herbida]|uniref:Uncharacterized protein n=1 Tax=Actinocorallia herbida TaxID=58109 RepID=A0A3N1D6N3_9ACTN|nr:hypothetical protein [Actinocorallia herbida]ROO89174.1 hypothetical protein EDD29_6861 [Actinocorallia herbida]
MFSTSLAFLGALAASWLRAMGHAYAGYLDPYWIAEDQLEAENWDWSIPYRWYEASR